MCIISSVYIYAIPLSTDEEVLGEVNRDDNLQNMDFIFNFLSDEFENINQKQDHKINEKSKSRAKEVKDINTDENSSGHRPITSVIVDTENAFEAHDEVLLDENKLITSTSDDYNISQIKDDADETDIDGRVYAVRPKLLIPKIEGSFGRQNKVYWTDEELLLISPSNDHTSIVENLELTESSQREKQSAGLVQNKERSVKKAQKFPTGAEIFDGVNINSTNDDQLSISSAEDRQFAMSLSDLSVDTIEDIFEATMLRLPNDIDVARDAIIEKIATKNMLGYTIASGFFIGATLDSISDLLRNQRNFTEIFTVGCLWYQLGWTWFYAVGYAGPWLFPSTFNGGDPNLLCSSEDLLSILADTDLNTNLGSITTSKSESEVFILSERLRLVFRSRLNCIVGKKDKYSEAEFVHGSFERLLDMINLHHGLTTPVQQVNDLDLVDAELLLIWDNMSVLVQEVHDDVTASRALRSQIYVFIGMLNLVASIIGIFLETCAVDFTNIPGGPVGAPFINMVDERFTNDFLLGHGLAAVAEQSWGYSYHMTYFLFVEEADPGCGLEDMDNVYSRYQQLRSFQVLMSTGQVRPRVAKYYVAEWKRELSVALHCLLTTKEGSRLRDTIDMFVTLANYRLDRS